MGWFNDEFPGHEGYIVGLVPVDLEAARAAGALDLGGEEWRQYLDRHGRPVCWRELSSKGAAGEPDKHQTVRVIQVGCDCGWRSQHFYAPSGTRFAPSIVLLPREGAEGLEDHALRVWRRHCEESKAADQEDKLIDSGERCPVFRCGEKRGHDGVLGPHAQFASRVRRLYPIRR
jgi:hypothetical protein